MGIGDQLQKLDELRRQGALTDQEFAIAKQKILTEPSSIDTGPLAELKAQNEIAQLDRAWELERQNYMVQGRYGNSYIPTEGSSLIGGVILATVGVVWTMFAFALTGFGQLGLISLAFPGFGICFVLFGVGMSIHSFWKAGQYKEAYARYQQQRQELIKRQ